MYIIIVLLLCLSINIATSSGHPVIIKTIPEQSSNTYEEITKIITHYSEDIEINFSKIKIFDINGKQIDNDDIEYFDGHDSLIITTPKLSEGVYTVNSTVLSKIDGHIVDHSFVFGVNTQIEENEKNYDEQGAKIFWPQIIIIFPNFIGQSIVFGFIFSYWLIWNKLKNRINNEKQILFFNKKIFAGIKIGIFFIFISNLFIIITQSIRLETEIIDIIKTSFGMIITTKIIITILFLIIIHHINNNNFRNNYKIIITSIAVILILTTTMTSHSMAEGKILMIILDFIHNLISAIWIGGIIFLRFMVLSNFTINKIKAKTIFFITIPRFSIVFTVSLGFLFISGLIMFWGFGNDLESLFNSFYGSLIITKIIIALILVFIGGYNQFKIQKQAILTKKYNFFVHKLKKSITLEIILGIFLFGIVSLLINSPDIESIDNTQNYKTNEFKKTIIGEKSKISVDINPFKIGSNKMIIGVKDIYNNDITDIKNLNLRLSNINMGVNEIKIPVNKNEINKSIYYGEIVFGFSGKWQINVDIQHNNNPNESITFDVIIKPKLTELQKEITEYELPDPNAKPLHVIYNNDKIWISDTAKSRLWEFIIEDNKFQSFDFNGRSTVALTYDSSGKIWFTDTLDNKIGFIDLLNNDISIIQLPIRSVATDIKIDLNKNIWISLIDKHMLLKYDQKNMIFESYMIPTSLSAPSSINLDYSDNIWYTESQAGNIGYIDLINEKMNEIRPGEEIKEPFSLHFDNEVNLWISEHGGSGIIKFDPILNKFQKISVGENNALPTGLIHDKYGNIWFAQHTADKLGVYDPHNDDLINIDIPTSNSFTQFVTVDNKNKIWFAEQRTNKLGVVNMIEIIDMHEVNDVNYPQYFEIVAPIIGIIIITLSLFFVKNINEKRRLDRLIE